MAEPVQIAGRVFDMLGTRALRLFAIVATFGSAGLVYAHGGSTISIVFAVVLLVALAIFWLLVSFWRAFFATAAASRPPEP